MRSMRSSRHWLPGFFSVILVGVFALTASAEPPIITSLTPDAAIAGGTEVSLTIHGENFTPASTAALGANKLATTFVSTTELTAAIPSSLIAEAGAIDLTISTESDTSAAATFTIHPAPAVTIGLSAAPRLFGLAVGPRGGVSLAAHRFTPLPPAIAVLSSASGATRIDEPTPITGGINLPSAAPSNSTSDSLTMSFVGASTPAFAFVVALPPTITGLTPATAVAGGAAFTLTINGTNFDLTSAAAWGATALATTYVSATQVTASVPANLIASAGTAGITVSTDGGTTISASFTINPPPPTITSLTPTSVLSSSGTFTLTVNGTNFISGTNATAVRWNYTALATAYVSSTQVTATVPSSVISAGTFNIAVVTASGTSPSVVFTVNQAPPVISSLSPGTLYVNTGSFMLYVFGKYFTSTTVVNWAGTPLTTTLISGSSLTAIVPASLMTASGSVSITVSNAGGTSNALSFNVMALPPTITSLSPASAAAGSAQFSLTINGTNFTPNSTSLVRLGTTCLSTAYISATQLKATVPAKLITSAGLVEITVIQGGGVTSMAYLFPINPAPPTLSSLSPSSATAGSADFMLNLTGNVFTHSATVLWGTTPLGTIYVSPSQLIAAVPASLVQYSGTGSVTVTTAAGISAPAVFTINPAPPAISGLYPSVASVGSAAFNLTINGAYFTNASTSMWGATALTTTYISSTQLTAAIPANLISAGTDLVTVTTSAGTSPPASFTIYPQPKIKTVSMPSGTAGIAYSGPIHVTGGVPGYTWTVTGLPGSFSYYNSSGSVLTITGVPAAAGATTFQVSAQDSAGVSAGPVSLTINAAAGPTGVGNGALNGNYTCLLQGSIDDDGSRWATVASFQADGQGNFTNGVFDTNSLDIGSASGFLTGSYNLGSSNNGLASIHTILTNNAAGIQTSQWALALSGNAQPAQQFRMVETDDLGTNPSGQQGTANCYLATPAAFAAGTVSGYSFAFGMDGEDNDSNLKATVGQFSASNGAISGGYLDSALGGSATVQSSAFSGSYTAPDPASGRFTIALNGALNSTGFTVYIIDASRMFILDNTSDDGEQAGNLRLQQQAANSGAAIDGPFVFYARGAEFNSNSGIPTSFYANVFEGSGDGQGNLTITQSYSNNAGVYAAGQSDGGPTALTFDPAHPGRVTFAAASGTTYMYFFNTNSSFEMTMGGNGSIDTGRLEAQTQTTFTNAALAGSYLFGELPLLSVTPTGYLGNLNLSGGVITGVATTSAENLLSWNQSLSAAYAWDATAPGTGGFVLSNGADGTASCVAVSATKFVCASQSDPAPSIQIVEQ